MITISRRQWLALLGTSGALGALPYRAFAQDAPLDLKWADLVPPTAPRRPKSFLAGRAPDDPGQPPSSPANETGPEGRWMSGNKPKISEPVPVVESLNGKRISIGGYIVPLDFDATTVKEFLLVPFVGACVHVPPPPPNQLVFVTAAKGAKVAGMFAPVTVIGRLTTTPSFTGLADAGYTLDAERVEPRKE